MKSKLIILASALAALVISNLDAVQGQTATPAPVPLSTPVPAPHVVTFTSVFTPAQFQAWLNFVPSSPQSLQSLIASAAPTPSGVTVVKLLRFNVNIPADGVTNIIVSVTAQVSP